MKNGLRKTKKGGTICYYHVVFDNISGGAIHASEAVELDYEYSLKTKNILEKVDVTFIDNLVKILDYRCVQYFFGYVPSFLLSSTDNQAIKANSMVHCLLLSSGRIFPHFMQPKVSLHSSRKSTIGSCYEPQTFAPFLRARELTTGFSYAQGTPYHIYRRSFLCYPLI
jgi:hypothetical protein